MQRDGAALDRMELAPDQGLTLPRPHKLTVAHFVFTCPATGMNVQHQLDDDPDIPENEYEAIVCPACTCVHFLNRKTGKLLGQDEE
jgi:hypothetical protein